MDNNTASNDKLSRGCFPSGQPNWVAPEITETECSNLEAGTGLDGNARDNASSLSQLLCDIAQEVEAIANDRIMVIATNDESKCQDDTDPTLAAMWSRILRFAQAAACVMCAYDPFVATILRSGRYPQILVGAAQAGGYPQWAEPAGNVLSSGTLPVTGQAVVDYVEKALLGVWHLWKEHPEFDYFAQTMSDPTDIYNLSVQMRDITPREGQTALIAKDGEDHSVLYTYKGGEWVRTKVFTSSDGLVDFAVTHINNGYYATKGVYYFHDGDDGTWQVMDTDLGDLKDQIDTLMAAFEKAVQSPSVDEQYILTTRPTAAEAHAVPCDPKKTTIVLITG